MADAVGPEGADFYPHLHGVNQDRDGILSMLYDMMTNPDADEDDVSVFYYSGHGVMSDTKTWRGALVGTDMGLVTVDEVQYYLDRTPGTIVVILDSCLSGQFITSKSVSPALQKAQVAAFGDAWINSFASSKTVTSKALTTSPQKSRFKILTAREAMESSWGADSVYGYGWFTKWAAGGFAASPTAKGDFHRRPARRGRGSQQRRHAERAVQLRQDQPAPWTMNTPGGPRSCAARSGVARERHNRDREQERLIQFQTRKRPRHMAGGAADSKRILRIWALRSRAR